MITITHPSQLGSSGGISFLNLQQKKWQSLAQTGTGLKMEMMMIPDYEHFHK